MKTLLVIVSFFVAMNILPANARPLSLDDVMKSEAIGRLAFDPSGRYAVFEYLPPYESSIKPSRNYSYANGRSKLYFVDLEGDNKARRLFPQPDGVNAWMGTFSPSGSILAVYIQTDAGVEAAVINLENQQLQMLGIVPDIVRYRATPLWLSDNEFIYPVLNDGRQPARPALMTASEEIMSIGQRLVWSNPQTEVSASVVYTHPEERVEGSRPVGELIQIDLRTLDRTTLAEGDFKYLSVSPNGDMLAAVRENDHPPVHGDQRIDRSLNPTGTSADVILVNLANSEAEIQVCSACDAYTSFLRWSESGKNLLYLQRPENGTWREPAVRSFDLATETTSTVANQGHNLRFRGNRIQIAPIAPDWFNDHIVAAYMPKSLPFPYGSDLEDLGNWWLSDDAGHFRKLNDGLLAGASSLVGVSPEALIFSSEGEILAFMQDGQVENLTEDIGQPVNTRSFGDDNGGLTAPRQREKLLLQAVAESGETDLYSLDVPSRSLSPVGSVPSGMRAIAASPKSGWLAFLESKNDFPRRLYLQRPNEAAKVAFEFNEHIDETEPVEIIQLKRVSANGQEVSDWLIPPPGQDAGNEFPVIIYPYGGRPVVRAPSRHWTSPVVSIIPLLDAGYGVLVPTIPLADWGMPSEPLEEIGDGLESAVVNMLSSGFGHPERLGLIGNSYGGYSVLSAATRSNRYKAVVAQGAPVNLSSYYGAFDVKMRGIFDAAGLEYHSAYLHIEAYQGRMGLPPWRDPDRYVRNSPIFHADRIEAPIMLIQGDLDSVPISEGEQMFTALYRQNKRAAFVRYWGEAHGIFGPANLKDMYSRIVGWFDRHVKEVVPEQNRQTVGQ